MPEKMKTIPELIELEEFELCLGEVPAERVFCGVEKILERAKLFGWH